MKQPIRIAVLALVSVLALAVQPLFAEDARSERLAERFAAADTNHDGKLTRAEAAAGLPRLVAMFDQIDTGHAGYITLAQFTAFAANHQR